MPKGDVLTADGAWPQFREAARKYCDVIESASEFSDADSFYAAVAVPLATLYVAGLALPRIPPSEEDAEIETLDHIQWRLLFDSINALTGEDDPYRTVVDPHNDIDAVELALADDLADTYRDVLPATTLDNPNNLPDLLWELRFSFHNHWGRHALEALRAIHWRRGDW